MYDFTSKKPVPSRFKDRFILFIFLYDEASLISLINNKVKACYTAQKKKFSIKDFFNKCDQILNEKFHFFMQR